MIKGILPVRGADPHGEGKWGAKRGSRTHRGVDYAAFVGTRLCSPIMGECTKVGYPYADDLSLRYVQVTDDRGVDHRFFYLEPALEVGDQVMIGDILGTIQDLEKRYPGITPHCHYEMRRNGHYLNPELETQR